MARVRIYVSYQHETELRGLYIGGVSKNIEKYLARVQSRVHNIVSKVGGRVTYSEIKRRRGPRGERIAWIVVTARIPDYEVDSLRRHLEELDREVPNIRIRAEVYPD